MDNAQNPGMIDMQVLVQREKDRQESRTKLIRKFINFGIKLEKDDECDKVMLRKLIKDAKKILKEE